eukprot:3370252-Rhodomonas_salina.1
MADFLKAIEEKYPEKDAKLLVRKSRGCNCRQQKRAPCFLKSMMTTATTGGVYVRGEVNDGVRGSSEGDDGAVGEDVCND